MVGARHLVEIRDRHTPVSDASGNVTWTESLRQVWGRVMPLSSSETHRDSVRGVDERALLILAVSEDISSRDQVRIDHESVPALYHGEWDVIEVGEARTNLRVELARRSPSVR